MTIRSMREDDIPKLAAIVSTNYDPHCAQMFYPDARCAFSDDPWRPRWIVAEENSEPIGCLCWAIDWSSWGNFNICWVQVRKDKQSRGVGKAMMNAALAEIKPQAALVLISTTKAEYYRKNWGFQPLINYCAIYNYDGSETETLMALPVTQREG